MTLTRDSNRSMAAVILTLAWPTILEQLLQTAVSYIDTIMVGVLGTYATAAVGATSTVNWLIGSATSALGMGFLAYISQAYGAGQKQKAVHAVAQTAMMVLVVGSLFTAVTTLLSHQIPVWMQVDASIRDLAADYFLIIYIPMLPRTASVLFGTVLRATGDTKTPMRIGVLVNLINVALNFLLIFPTRQIMLFGLPVTIWGADWGVIGAAIASAVSFAFGGIAITVKVWRHPEVSPKGCSLKPEPEILKPCLRVALPNMLQRFATSLGYVAFASMINALGDISTAAHTIANTVESAFYIPGFGMQTAAATLAGNAYGARDDEKLRHLGKTLLPIEVALMTLTGGLLFLLAPSLVQLFTKDAEVIALGSRVLRMVAVSEPFYGVSIMIEGMMLGMGSTLVPFVFNVSGMWCVRIAGTFVMTRLLGLGLEAAWGCMIAHNMLLFILYLIRYLSGRWDPMQTPARSRSLSRH